MTARKQQPIERSPKGGESHQTAVPESHPSPARGQRPSENTASAALGGAGGAMHPGLGAGFNDKTARS